MLTLRPYQKAICKKLAEAVSEGKRRILLSAPTGAGKTVIFTDFAKKVLAFGYKTLIIVDRIELLEQTRRHATQDIPFGILSADKFFNANIVVCMLQTLNARLKSENYQEWLAQYDIIFFDEVHQYCEGNAFARICEFTKETASIVGCSATPWNHKGFLLKGFDVFINECDISSLIESGFLVKPVHYTVDLFDFKKVKITSTGDYDTGAIDDIVIDIRKTDKVLVNWQQYAGSKKTIAFCSTVLSAKHYADSFKAKGIRAEVVSAQNTSLERQNILKRFKNGEIQILFNVGLLVAGFDEPSIECVVFLNPTAILRRYIQCAGRGLRLCPEINKQECLFLDFVGNSFRHLEVDAIRSYVEAPEKNKETFDEIECPVCHTVFSIKAKECPECGFILDASVESMGGGLSTKSKKEYEKLIKLKSLQTELKETIYQFIGHWCLIKIAETGEMINNTPEKKWVFGERPDGSPIFKGSYDYDPKIHVYPLTTMAKKSNCWYVFHTICLKYNPKESALRYYGKKLRKAKRFLEQIKNPNNKAFVNLYRLMD